MALDLMTVVEYGSFAEVAAALPGASQVDINHAVLAAVAQKRDAVFDLLLPEADPGYGSFAALRNASLAGYLHAIKALLPHANPPALSIALLSAMSNEHEACALTIIDHLPLGFDGLNAFGRACRQASPVVVRSLVPFIKSEALQGALFTAALRRPDLVEVLAPVPAADIPAVIRSLLAVDSWPNNETKEALFAAHHAAADFLLPFVPAAERAPLIQEHPALKAHPHAAAHVHAAELERAIPAARCPSAPRM